MAANIFSVSTIKRRRNVWRALRWMNVKSHMKEKIALGSPRSDLGLALCRWKRAETGLRNAQGFYRWADTSNALHMKTTLDGISEDDTSQSSESWSVHKIAHQIQVTTAQWKLWQWKISKSMTRDIAYNYSWVSAFRLCWPYNGR